MKTLTKTLLLLFALSFVFNKQSHAQLTPKYQPAEILNDTNFAQYINKTLGRLSENYIAYDTAGKVISKLEFLKHISTAKYLYLLLNTPDNSLALKLYKLSAAEEKKYGFTIYAFARFACENYLRVGQKFTQFDFTDIKGNHYTNENTKGKILVIKYWFLHCGACVAEIPELNKLVKSYKDRKDVLFLSVVTDSTSALKAFLNKKPFDYINIGDQASFINDNLKIGSFPTEFIINQQGTIVNVVDTAEEVDYSLKNDI